MARQQNIAKMVLVVNIDAESDSDGLFVSIYDGLMQHMKNHPLLEVEIINSVDLLTSKCIENNPMSTVLLFTNEIVTKNENLLNIVRPFVAGGGLAIFGCLFASFVRPDHGNQLFRSLGLQWKMSSYDGMTFGISHVGKFLLKDVEERFFARAHMLTNVSPEQRLYTPLVDATTQSNVLLSETIDASMAMTAFTKVGKGAVCYIGNHDVEESFIRLYVALSLANW